MHEALLSEVIDRWNTSGILPVLEEVIRKVWLDNTDRHDPAAGDDALTLGVQSARNIVNVTIRQFTDHPRVEADQPNNSLRVRHGGRTLRVYKLPGNSIDVDPHSASWDASDTKLSGPHANSIGTPQSFLDYPEGADAFANTVPSGPEYLHLVWAGDPDTGQVAIHVGFPRDDEDGGSPWFAVEEIYRDKQARAGRPSGRVPNGSTRFDELAPHPVDVRPRRAPVTKEEK